MKKILIADHDPNITAALAVRLRASGYEVLTAANGYDALKLIMTQVPALVLMDIWMPAGLGFSVAQRLQAYGLDIPIVFLTASRMQGLRAAAEQVGAAGYLEKPYDGEELLATVRFALGETATISAAAARVADASPQTDARKKILIIEDDPKTAMALGLRMQQAGFEPASAGDGLTGVQTAVKFQPDLVLLDVNMPALEGISVAERIQKMVSAPVPVIFISGSHQPELKDGAEQFETVYFLDKPSDSRRLLTRVQQTLASTRTGTRPKLEPQPQCAI